jgi:hypothetical protein
LEYGVVGGRKGVWISVLNGYYTCRPIGISGDHIGCAISIEISGRQRPRFSLRRLQRSCSSVGTAETYRHLPLVLEIEKRFAVAGRLDAVVIRKLSNHRDTQRYRRPE